MASELEDIVSQAGQKYSLWQKTNPIPESLYKSFKIDNVCLNNIYDKICYELIANLTNPEQIRKILNQARLNPLTERPERQYYPGLAKFQEDADSNWVTDFEVDDNLYRAVIWDYLYNHLSRGIKNFVFAKSLEPYSPPQIGYNHEGVIWKVDKDISEFFAKWGPNRGPVSEVKTPEVVIYIPYLVAPTIALVSIQASNKRDAKPFIGYVNIDLDTVASTPYTTKIIGKKDLNGNYEYYFKSYFEESCQGLFTKIHPCAHDEIMELPLQAKYPWQNSLEDNYKGKVEANVGDFSMSQKANFARLHATGLLIMPNGSLRNGEQGYVLLRDGEGNPVMWKALSDWDYSEASMKDIFYRQSSTDTYVVNNSSLDAKQTRLAYFIDIDEDTEKEVVRQFGTGVAKYAKDMEYEIQLTLNALSQGFLNSSVLDL